MYNNVTDAFKTTIRSPSRTQKAVRARSQQSS